MTIKVTGLMAYYTNMEPGKEEGDIKSGTQELRK